MHPFLRLGFCPVLENRIYDCTRDLSRGDRSFGVAFVLVHTPPSGAASPSDADLQLTNRVAAAAQILQIHFLDHVIGGRRFLQFPGSETFVITLVESPFALEPSDR